MLKRLFGFDPAQNSVRTEVFAGITSFLTMSYILAVNPQLFASLDGMPRGAVFTTTALIAVLGSLLMAIVAKLPFGVAPGMGSNTFFVFAICLGLGVDWRLALTAVFVEGLIMILLTITNLREAIVNSIPKSIQQALTIGIGLFIAFVGLQKSGIVIDDSATLIKLGDITHGSALLALIGLLITSTLVILDVKGGMLIGILVTTIIGIPMGITKYEGIVSLPQSITPIFAQFQWSQVFSVQFLVVLLSFLFIDLFSLTGSALGLCLKGGFVDENGKVPRLKGVFLADSVGTAAASLFGTCAVTAFVESSSGVAQGGRTGLTSFTIAVCFTLALFLSPVFLAIPAAATAPVMVIVGMMMFSSITDINLTDLTEAIPAFITIIVMPMAYSIADGIMIGTISYVLINLCCGRFRKLSVGMYVLAALFVLKYIFI